MEIVVVNREAIWKTEEIFGLVVRSGRLFKQALEVAC